MVVLPEPMNPARQIMDGRGVFPRSTGVCVTIAARMKLIALQDANCTTEGGELDFGEAAANAAEEALHILGSDVACAVRIGFQESLRAIVHGPEIGLGVEVERIRAREANF